MGDPAGIRTFVRYHAVKIRMEAAGVGKALLGDGPAAFCWRVVEGNTATSTGKSSPLGFKCLSPCPKKWRRDLGERSERS